MFFSQFEIIINVLVSLVRFILILKRKTPTRWSTLIDHFKNKPARRRYTRAR